MKMDSELREKFEASPEFVGFDFKRDDEYWNSDTYHAWLGYLAAWRAAYEAGEIAMKEKAAQRIHHAFCRTIDRMQNICDCDELADAIRALPLSGAEESKK